MKRVAAALLTVTGLVLLLVGLMGAVLVGPDGEWQANGTVPAGRSAVVVQPSLSSVLGPRVELTATSGDRTELFVGRALPEDARALLADVPVADVHGLADSRRLAIRPVDGGAELPPVSDVDLWQAQAVGTGTARLGWTPTPGAESLLVARTDGSPLPRLELTMTWRDPSWRWLPVGVALAGVVLIGASLLLRRQPTRRGRRAR